MNSHRIALMILIGVGPFFACSSSGSRPASYDGSSVDAVDAEAGSSGVGAGIDAEAGSDGSGSGANASSVDAPAQNASGDAGVDSPIDADAGTGSKDGFTSDGAFGPDGGMVEAWQAFMRTAPLPGAGCYTADYPATAWQPTSCGDAPTATFSVGNDVGYTARSHSNILSATGSFTQVTGPDSETDVPPPTAPFFFNETATTENNGFSIQLNSNFFPTAPACGSKAGCYGWEQFVFINNPSGKYNQKCGAALAGVFQEYWLFNYGNKCPPDPIDPNASPTAPSNHWQSVGNTNNCEYKSPFVDVPVGLTIDDLSSISLTAQASAGLDSTIFTSNRGKARARASGAILGLATRWNEVEFNVFGIGNLSEAKFMGITRITSKVTVAETGNAGLSCGCGVTTGETNNLNLVSCSPLSTGTGIQFTEDSVQDPSSDPCALGTCGDCTNNNRCLVQLAPLPASVPDRPVSVAADDKNVYWVGFGNVFSLPLAGGSITTLATNAHGGGGIAVNGDTLYWTAFGTGSDGAVYSMPVGGGPITTIASGRVTPRAIAVDPTSGSVYWSEYNSIVSPNGPVWSGDAGRGAPPLAAYGGRVYWPLPNGTLLMQGPQGVGTYATTPSRGSYIVANADGVSWVTSDGIWTGPAGSDSAPAPRLLAAAPNVFAMDGTSVCPDGVYFLSGNNLGFVGDVGTDVPAPLKVLATVQNFTMPSPLGTPFVAVAGNSVVWFDKAGIWKLTPRRRSARSSP